MGHTLKASAQSFPTAIPCRPGPATALAAGVCGITKATVRLGASVEGASSASSSRTGLGARPRKDTKHRESSILQSSFTQVHSLSKLCTRAAFAVFSGTLPRFPLLFCKTRTLFVRFRFVGLVAGFASEGVAFHDSSYYPNVGPNVLSPHPTPVPTLALETADAAAMCWWGAFLCTTQQSWVAIVAMWNMWSHVCVCVLVVHARVVCRVERPTPTNPLPSDGSSTHMVVCHPCDLCSSPAAGCSGCPGVR